MKHGLRMLLSRFSRRIWLAALLSIGCVLVITLKPMPLQAQEADSGAEMKGPSSMRHEAPDVDGDHPAPVPQVPLREGITGSMMVTPPYGNAPLRVGFFVVASDPENIGFLTFQWNFGDGTVSSLPPELYIFHNYAKPGNYLCSLIVKTTDGRSKTFFQGVIVKDAAG